jgi:ribosomal protein S18 acetylase RimI-like enzyme
MDKYPLEIVFHKELTNAERNQMRAGFNLMAKIARDIPPIEPFAYTLTDREGQFQGGIEGMNLFGDLYVRVIYIEEPYRSQGYGTALVEKAEKFARERGCHMITLDTFDWQARPFYEKLGFKLEFIRTGYYNGGKRYYMRKDLE